MMLLKHIARLRLYDGHKHLYALSLKVLDSSLHSVNTALVHERNATHTDDDNL